MASSPAESGMSVPPSASAGTERKIEPVLDSTEYLRLRRELLMQLMKNEINRETYQHLLGELNKLYQLGSRLMKQEKQETATAESAPSTSSMKFNPPPTLGGISPGTQIFEYTVISRLGRGGMGTVYKAEDATGQPVAIKLFPAIICGNERELARVQATFDAVKRLDHPNISQVYRLEEHPIHGLLLVMQFCPGITLDEYLELFRTQHGNMNVAQVCHLLKPIADALDYAHAFRVIHRDIKPSNIMLDRDGANLKLIDFGLAAQIRTSVVNVSNVQSEVAGTRPYMAPEQWQGHVADAKTDQYALACVAYEMLSGHPPFQSLEAAVLERCHRTESIPPISSLNALVNAVFWIDEPRPTDLYALAKNRASRFPSCQAFLTTLHEREPQDSRYPHNWSVFGSGIMCHKKPVMQAAAIGDGKIFVTADEGGTIIIWDLGTRQAIRRIRLPSGMPTSMAIGSNERTIFLGTNLGRLLMIDVTSGEVLQGRQAHQGALTSMMLGPKHVLATAGTDGVVALYNEDTLESIGQTEPGGMAVTAIAWSPGGMLGWGDAGGKVNVAALDSHEPAAAFQAHNGEVTALCFSRENRSLITGGRDGCVHSFSLAGKHRMHTFLSQGPRVIFLEFLIGTDQFLALTADGKCHHFELYKRAEIGVTSVSHAKGGAGCYLTCQKIVVFAEESGLIRLLSLERGGEVISKHAYLYPLSGLEIVAKRNILLTAHISGEVLFWDMETQKVLLRRTIESSPIRRMGLLDSDRVVWTWHQDGRLIFTEARSGQKIGPQLPVEIKQLTCLCGDKGANDLLLGTVKGELVLLSWPLTASTVQPFIEELQYSCFEDIDQPASLAGSETKLNFKLDEARQVARIQAGNQPLSAVAYHSRQNLALAISKDGQISIFHVTTEKLISRFPFPAAAGAAFAPDGTLLAVWQNTGKISLFSPHGVETTTLEGHQGAIHTCAFSPDGAWLASGSADQTVRVTPLRGSEKPILLSFESQVSVLRFLPGNALLVGLEDGSVVRTTPLF